VGAPATTGDQALQLERYRVELAGYCYRMLASGFEAEDAVQETFVRVWRALDRFDATRGSLRAWLFAIATNVCLDMLRGPQRRARAMDLGPASPAGAALGAPIPESAWVLPVPDARVLPAGGDPADLAAQRASIRLAFVAALQHLPPRQRAVLILRDVLCWRAEEVARLLDTSLGSVTSALQRARATLRRVAPDAPADPLDARQRDLLARYCSAFERYDVEGLVALLHEDATMSTPPFTWWLRGRAEVRRVLLAGDRSCRGARLLPVATNGSSALAQYRPGTPGGPCVPFALIVVEAVGGRIAEITTYLGAERLFPLFDLPPVYPQA
jgi:RNA polymerase sigma-70 factor (ECF subfamily)